MTATLERPTIPADTELLTPDELFKRLDGQTFSLDCETTGLHWSNVHRAEHTKDKCASTALVGLPVQRWADRVVGASIACPETGVATYIPFEWGETRNEAALDRFCLMLNALVQNAKTTIVLHNAKFDLHFLGLDPNHWMTKCAIADTSVMAHLIDSRAAHQGGIAKSLESLEVHYLGTTRKHDHLAAHKAKSARMFATWTLEEQQAYAGDDAVITIELYKKLLPRLEKEGLLPLFKKEMKYLRILWEMERRGILIDPAVVEEQIEALEHARLTLEQQAYAQAGHEFNPRSAQQLSKLLYEELKIPKPQNPYQDEEGASAHRSKDEDKYNSTCTSADLLARIDHPLARTVLDLRETHHHLGRLTRWLSFADEHNVLHTTLRLTGTRTGRLSSASPELQNIPGDKRSHRDASGRTGFLVNLRAPIISRPGMSLVSIDHKQQESRLFAILAGEETLLDVLREGGDLHTTIAELVWGETNDVLRQWSKEVSFGLTYGMTETGLAQRLGKTPGEAQLIVSKYLDTFPRLRQHMAEVERAVKREKKITYWDGRIWREEDPHQAYRGVNAEVQGGAAGLLSVAGLRMAKVLKKGPDAGWLLLPVHDEWLLELKDDALPFFIPALQQCMEFEDIFGLKFPSDVSVGKSWGLMREWVP